jgi:hypothetical protein
VWNWLNLPILLRRKLGRAIGDKPVSWWLGLLSFFLVVFTLFTAVFSQLIGWRGDQVIQYIIICRFPIFGAIFPWIFVPLCLRGAPRLLRNLLLIDSLKGVVVVSLLATLHALVVIRTFLLDMQLAGSRLFNLVNVFEDCDSWWAWWKGLMELHFRFPTQLLEWIILPRLIILPGLIILPVILAVIVLPRRNETTDAERKTGFDLRLMLWGNGSAAPNSGENLVVLGIDNNGLLHIRIFDATGNRTKDTDETQLPAQAAAIATLKQLLPGLMPPHVLTDTEKKQVIALVTSIVGQTRKTELAKRTVCVLVGLAAGQVLLWMAGLVQGCLTSLTEGWNLRGLECYLGPGYVTTDLGWRLRLIRVDNVSDLPTRDQRRFIVAEIGRDVGVDKVLHFRIFDNDCRMDEDKAENELEKQTAKIEDLRKKLVPLWPRDVLTEREVHQIVLDVASIVGYRLVKPGQLRPPHLHALSFLFLNLIVYWVAGRFLRPGGGIARKLKPWFPPLAYLLFLSQFGCWVLTELAFLLDYYRIPVLPSIAAVSLSCYFISGSNHYFQLIKKEHQATRDTDGLKPGLCLRKWLEHRKAAGEKNPRMLIVATSGGGILMSAWTARVLSGLAKEIPGFVSHLVFISSVSGGSVGTMYFLEGLQKKGFREENGTLTEEAMNAICKSAEDSSLEEISWGLAYPDLWRLIFSPINKWLFSGRDRGWALEQAWKDQLRALEQAWKDQFPDRRDALSRERGSSEKVTLRDWAKEASEGRLPAVAFNCVIVETGERFLFSTYKADPDEARTFLELFPDHDVHVVTAARLSATYPYVSPVAQAGINKNMFKQEYHLADGGYYDNFGVMTAIEWLRSVLEKPGPESPDVLVLRIQLRSKRERASAPLSQSAGGGRHGWFQAVFGPFRALREVRSSTQAERGTMELKLLEELYDAGKRKIEIAPPFELVHDGPLSWKLGQEDSDKLKEACDCYRDKDTEGRWTSKVMEKVERFLMDGGHG